MDDAQFRPRSPVVKSQAAATSEFSEWLEVNSYAALIDGDGLSWRVLISVELLPGNDDPKRPMRLLKLELTSSASCAELIRTATLDATGDARLVALIGDRRVPLAMKPISYSASSYEEARHWLAEELPRLKASLAAADLAAIKRRLVGVFVNKISVFGGREAALAEVDAEPTLPGLPGHRRQAARDKEKDSQG